MKIGLLTCMWGRPEVFKVFAFWANELKKHYDVKLVAVGSELEESETLALNHGFEYHEYINHPVSNKWNYGVTKMYDYDYVLMMGSDDITCLKLIRNYVKAMEQGFDFIGIDSCYIYDAISNQMVYWGGYTNHRRGEPSGMARCLSKDLLEKLDYEPWANGINKGLDGTMWQKLKKVYAPRMIFNCQRDNIFACDIKTGFNVTKFDSFIGLPNCNLRIMENHLGE